MILSHVLTGKAEPIAAKSGLSGINKQPRTDSVAVGLYGLEGDIICDTQHHGGLQQAVYIFGGTDYAWWQNELGRDLPPGTFGENLIVSRLATPEVRIGDVFVIGDVNLSVTFPRIPCITLAIRMNDRTFPRRFLRSGYTGVYCSVLQTGQLQAGMSVAWQPQATDAPLAISGLGAWENVVE